MRRESEDWRARFPPQEPRILAIPSAAAARRRSRRSALRETAKLLRFPARLDTARSATREAWLPAPLPQRGPNARGQAREPGGTQSAPPDAGTNVPAIAR